MAVLEIITARQGDTLDALAWRERGLGAADLGALLAINRGIADLGPVLPIGTQVRVPAASSAPAVPTIETINLWD